MWATCNARRIKALEGNDTQDLVELPEGKNISPNRDGYIKSRLWMENPSTKQGWLLNAMKK